MSSNKCFYLTYFFLIYYFSKMPLRYEQKPSRAFFIFFDGHAIVEEVRREPYVTSSTQGQLSGQNSLHFYKPQLPAWMDW